MAVEIPVVKRADAMAPIAQEQVNLQAPSLKDTSAQREGFGNLVEGAIDSYGQYEKTKLSVYDLKSTDKANQFESTMKARLAEIKSKEGDTTEDYMQFDQDMQKLAEEMTTADEPYGQEYKDILARKLFNTSSKLRGVRDTQQSTQQYAYRKRVVDQSITNDQENMLEYGSYLDITKPETFNQLDQIAQRIVTTRLADADQRGTLVRDANGNIDWEQGDTRDLISNDFAKVIKPMVKSMNNLGKIEESKKVLETFSERMRPSDRIEMMEDIDKSSARVQALGILEANNFSMSLREIDNYEGTPELRAALRSQMITRKGQEERMLNIQRKRSFESMSLAIENNAALPDGDPRKWASMEAFEQSQQYQAIRTTISPSQKKSLKNQFMGVTESDDFTHIELLNAVADGSILDMDETERAEKLNNLNPSDRRQVEKMIKSQLVDKDDKGVNKAINDMYGKLDDTLLNLTDDKGRSLLNPKNESKLDKALKGDTLAEYTKIKKDIAEKMNSDIIRGQWSRDSQNEYIQEAAQRMKAVRGNQGWGFSKPVPEITVQPKRNTLTTLNVKREAPAKPTNTPAQTTGQTQKPKLDLNTVEGYTEAEKRYKAKNNGARPKYITDLYPYVN